MGEVDGVFQRDLECLGQCRHCDLPGGHMLEDGRGFKDGRTGPLYHRHRLLVHPDPRNPQRQQEPWSLCQDYWQTGK